MEIFAELGVIIVIATIISGIIWILKQPLIIGYILTGIAVGPYVLNLIQSTDTITIFSHIGISLLLFIVGLSLSPSSLRYVGKVSLVTGLGQILFTSLFGFGICKLLGFSNMVSAYISVALTFSSTIIIMKLLSDKGDAEKLYGKISIGFLLVQDLVAVLILMVISSLSVGLDINTLVFGTILKGLGLLTILFLTGVYILPGLTRVIAKSQELLLLFSLGWCLALASLFNHFKFSIEIGALLAGVTLSMSPYRYEISSKMRQLRDFFIVLFFILLGAEMTFSDRTPYINPIVILSAFILIGNPLIVMVLMGLLGYTKRNGFLAGLTVAQISEFSLVLVALGVKVGHLTSDVLSLVTTVGIITITGSTYLIIYADRIYPHISNYLRFFEIRGKKVDEQKHHEHNSYDIILFGYDHIGRDLVESFKKLRETFLVVDYNPEIIIDLAKKGMQCRYGDVNDSELLDELNLSKAKIVVSTITDFDTNMFLIQKTRHSNKDVTVIVVSHQIDEAIELYEKGATYVIMPRFLGGCQACTLIEKYGLDANKLMEEKLRHIQDLKNKRDNRYEYANHHI